MLGVALSLSKGDEHDAKSVDVVNVVAVVLVVSAVARANEFPGTRPTLTVPTTSAYLSHLLNHSTFRRICSR